MKNIYTGSSVLAIAAVMSGCVSTQPMSFESAVNSVNDVTSNCMVYTGDMSNPRVAALNKLLTIDIKNERTEVKAEALRTFSTTAKYLYKQAHSVQLFRDASFALCNAFYSAPEQDSDSFSQSISTLLSVLETSTNNPKASDESLEKLSEGQLQAIHKDILQAKESWHDVIRESSKHNAYMMAQVYITKMAFESLNQEYQYVYQDAHLTRYVAEESKLDNVANNRSDKE